LPIRRHILYDQHKTDDAINEYRKAINLDPRYADPQINLGNALSDQHKTDDAINEDHKAIDLDLRFALAHCNLGNALRKRHNNGEPDEANIEFDKAIVEYREAIELDPHDATAHRNLSYALRLQGGNDAADAEEEKATSLSANASSFHPMRCLLKIGNPQTCGGHS
jgi:tetratricopeptide (TPR) repeat protein